MTPGSCFGEEGCARIGYACSREELEKHGADRIVESVGELRTRLLSEAEASGQGDPVREETDEA